jgi:hypothetical protein
MAYLYTMQWLFVHHALAVLVLKACVTCCPLLPLPAAVLAIAACVAALPAACPPLLLAALQQKIVERAKQMTEDDSADRLSQKAALQQEFEQLLNIFFTGRQHVPSAQCFGAVALGSWVMPQGAAVGCDMTCTAKAIAWQPGRAATQGSSIVASMHTPCQGEGRMFRQPAHLAL